MPHNLPYKEVYAYTALMRCSEVLRLQQQRHLSVQACRAVQQQRKGAVQVSAGTSLPALFGQFFNDTAVIGKPQYLGKTCSTKTVRNWSDIMA
jgi:hypothetical protein